MILITADPATYLASSGEVRAAPRKSPLLMCKTTINGSFQ